MSGQLPVGFTNRKHTTPLGTLRVTRDSSDPVFSATYNNLTPVAAATDVFTLAYTGSSVGQVARVKRIVITAAATDVGSLSVSIQRRANSSTLSSSGSAVSLAAIGNKQYNITPSVQFFAQTSNRSDIVSPGISGDQIFTYRTLPIGTSAAPASALVVDFEDVGCPTLRESAECLAINLMGATLPSGFRISATVVFSLEFPSVFAMMGDSTTDYRAKGGTVQTTILSCPGIESQYNFKNLATNGSTLATFLANGSGLYYTFTQAKALFPSVYVYGQKHKAVLCYGINDVRTGSTTQAQLIALIESWIAGMKTALPDVELILWGPNAIAADDYGSNGYVTTTGIFTGMTVAQAAQLASDIMYNAYASFTNDPRIKTLIQKQDTLGRTSVSVASFSGLMDDQLHPSARGQFLTANALIPYLL